MNRRGYVATALKEPLDLQAFAVIDSNLLNLSRQWVHIYGVFKNKEIPLNSEVM